MTTKQTRSVDLKQNLNSKMYRFYLGIALTVIVVSDNLVNAQFPDNPKACKYEDSDCITKTINYLMHEKIEGESSLNFVRIDPLSVSKISIKQGEESPVNIDLTFIKNDIIGLRNAVTYKVKGFGKDLKQKHKISMTVPIVTTVGDYTISGKVLILPISGSGKSNITMVNPNMDIYFSGTPMEKDGETYMNIKNLRIDLNPERMYYSFGNLFNGDKALGENMNLFLNENWKDIYNEVKVSISEAYSKIFQSVINNVFQKYPYEKLFAAE